MEIHKVLDVPDLLAHEWYNRGYHGLCSHNVRGILNRYLGFFDMNPANPNKLSPAESAPKYAAALGGAERVMTIVKAAHNKGEYRWAAELLNNVIFAQPDNMPERLLQANIFEQMAY